MPAPILAATTTICSTPVDSAERAERRHELAFRLQRLHEMTGDTAVCFDRNDRSAVPQPQ